MKKHIFVYLLLFALSLKAQDKTTNSLLDKMEFKIGYSGTIFWANGLTVGTEYLWKEKVKIKNRKQGKRTNTHQFFFNGNLGFATNFSTKTDTGVFTNYGITWRRTNTKGKQFSVELNPLGYYRSFLPETYEVNGANVNKVTLPGRSFYAPSICIGVGKLRKGKKLTGRYINLNLMLRTPFNAGTLPAVFLQYGYRFNLKKKK